MSETIEAPAPVETPDAPADDLRSVLSDAFDSHDTVPGRDDRGRFAPRNPSEDAPETVERADKDETDQPETEGSEPEAPAIAAPASWSDAEKAHFATLSREVQDVILRRERDVEKGFAERAAELKSVEPIRDVLKPYQAKHSMMGLTDAEAVRRLLAAQEALERDPDKAFPELARAFGYDLRRLTNPQQPNQFTQQSPAEYRDPRVDQMLAQQQAVQHAEAARAVDAFGKDPANKHFDDVRSHMGRLISADPSLSLKDAYDQAVWANATTREKLLSEQRQADEAKRLAEAKKRADAAKRAAVSVRSSTPSGMGSSAPADSLRSELERAFTN